MDTFGRVGSLKSQDGHQISVSMNWNSPANFSLEMDDGLQRVKLKPFEVYYLYEGMHVVEPTTENPLRTYKPNLIQQVNVFENQPKHLKPGF